MTKFKTLKRRRQRLRAALRRCTAYTAAGRIDLQQANQILRDIYLPAIQDQFKQSSGLLGFLKN